jgi:asparagine synthase (glutamine-hydrolysing)
MCGIVGYFSKKSYIELKSIICQMSDALTHRGPDDSGTWTDEETGIGLGHRRLSILDLSPLGRQPMGSNDERYIITFNGEVYNFLEMKKELESSGHNFRGGSDTEVILTAISHWGLMKALSRFIGMFAFALWDRQERCLHLVRDRLGIKPLYYGWDTDGSFLFSSELKALRKCETFDPSIDLDALAMFFRHNYIPAPFTVYKNAKKLLPGSMLTIDLNGLSKHTSQQKMYWSADEVWEKGLEAPWKGDDGEAVNRLEDVLKDAVKLRMIADVPLGAFLSGGIDSSTVTALMQASSVRPVKTFSIGFYEQGYDEAPMAKAVAKHLGTEHTELYVTEAEALEEVPKLCGFWDEPFADSSQIPTLLLSRLTRRHVTVALSGDGGDELFLGYPRYPATLKLWRSKKMIPGPLIHAGSAFFKILSPGVLDSLGCIERPLFRLMGVKGTLSDISALTREVLTVSNFSEFYGWTNSHFQPYGSLLKEKDSIAPQFFDCEACGQDRWANMSRMDIKTYLPDDILTKVDRASMAVGLEARVPILDHRVVEMAASLPTRLKIKNGVNKWILRQILYRSIPPRLVERPKMGFGVPIRDWLRGGLKDWASDLLSEDRIKAEGYLDAGKVSRLWGSHLKGYVDHKYILWNVLMFQAWMERWRR